MRSMQCPHRSRSNMTIWIQVVVHKQTTGGPGAFIDGGAESEIQIKLWILLTQSGVLTLNQLNCNKLLSKVFSLCWIILSIICTLQPTHSWIPTQQICKQRLHLTLQKISLHRQGLLEATFGICIHNKQSLIMLRKISTAFGKAIIQMHINCWTCWAGPKFMSLHNENIGT
jgi:hypothetical protein